MSYLYLAYSAPAPCSAVDSLVSWFSRGGSRAILHKFTGFTTFNEIAGQTFSKIALWLHWNVQILSVLDNKNYDYLQHLLC